MFCLDDELNKLEARCAQSCETTYQELSRANSIGRQAALVQLKLSGISAIVQDDEVQRALALLHRAKTAVDHNKYPEIHEGIEEIRRDILREHAERFVD